MNPALGCFRCGAMSPDIRKADNEEEGYYCGECGEKGIVTFQQALDLVNALYVTDEQAVLDEMLADDYWDDMLLDYTSDEE